MQQHYTTLIKHAFTNTIQLEENDIYFLRYYGMDFISLLIGSLLILCAFGAPMGILLMKPTAPQWLRSGKLLFPIFLLFLTLSYTGFSDCVPTFQIGCYLFKMAFILLAILGYIMYLGWFEYAWRRWHKQISWPLQKNLQYDFTSNIVIVISAFMTPLMVFLALVQNLKPPFQQ
jgi:hypothetical protein